MVYSPAVSYSFSLSLCCSQLSPLFIMLLIVYFTPSSHLSFYFLNSAVSKRSLSLSLSLALFLISLPLSFMIFHDIIFSSLVNILISSHLSSSFHLHLLLDYPFFSVFHFSYNCSISNQYPASFFLSLSSPEANCF